MIRVVIAMDSFKGSLAGAAAGRAVAEGVLAADPTAHVTVVAMADGGEGTVDALLAARPGRLVSVAGVDALGRPAPTTYALLDEGRTAVLESASAIGLGGVGTVDARLPRRAGSAGLGLLLRAALGSGATSVILGLGGTATTDGGTGLLVALGAGLLDRAGRRLPAGPGNLLWSMHDLDPTSLPDLAGTGLVALSDVDNPLLGDRGAAAVYGPQKGARPDQVEELERRMGLWCDLLERVSGRSVRDLPGAGAAGGIGAALLALGARLEPGAPRVAREIGLDAALVGADLVLTGEGAVDDQTGYGKAPAAVATAARRAGAVVVALAGRVDHPLGPAGEVFDAVLPIHPRSMTPAEALGAGTTAADLASAATQVVRLLAAARRAPDGRRAGI